MKMIPIYAVAAWMLFFALAFYPVAVLFTVAGCVAARVLWTARLAVVEYAARLHDE